MISQSDFVSLMEFYASALIMPDLMPRYTPEKLEYLKKAAKLFAHSLDLTITELHALRSAIEADHTGRESTDDMIRKLDKLGNVVKNHTHLRCLAGNWLDELKRQQELEPTTQ